MQMAWKGAKQGQNGIDSILKHENKKYYLKGNEYFLGG